MELTTTSTTPARVRPELALIGDPQRRVILAEDDSALRGELAAVLRRDGHEVVEVGDGVELVEHLVSAWPHEPQPRGASFDIIVTDVWLRGMTGLDVLAFLHSAHDATPVILINIIPGDDAVRAEALELGAAAIFHAPLAIDRFRATIRRVAPAWFRRVAPRW
jgi:DNA-binding response OmpR family regulator